MTGYQTPLDKALKPLQKQSFIKITRDSTPVQRHWAQFSGDPARLDLGDAFYALAHPSLYRGVPEVGIKLRGILGYRQDDPLRFETIPMGAKQQVALTIIEPIQRDANVPPIIFAAGFAHPGALYTPQLVALANEMHTQIVIVDAPGNGASQSSVTVNQNDFYAALKAAITREVPENTSYYVAGHSLGSSASYHLFKDIKEGKSPVGNRTLIRALVISPIPSRLHELSGAGTISRAFMLKGVASEAAHGFMGLKANSFPLFDNNIPEKLEGRKLVAREDVPISVPGLISTYGTIDLSDPAQFVGHDDRIVIVMAREDHLMNWDADTFAHHRGYMVIPGDHGACVTGTAVSSACTKTLVTALTGTLDPRQKPLEVSEIYRGVTSHIRLEIQGSTQHSLSVVPEIMLKMGTWTFGQELGLYTSGGFLADLGYKFGAHAHGIAMPSIQGTIGAEALRLPLFAEVGVRYGIDFMKPAEQERTTGIVTSIGTNLARIFDLTFKGNFDFSGKLQDISAGVAIRFN